MLEGSRTAALYAVQAIESVVLGTTLILLVQHAVATILIKAKTQHLSASRATTYELVLLAVPNITIQRCPPLNPVSPLLSVEDGEPS